MRGVLLVSTAGDGSMDRYGQQLARALPVPSVEVPLDEVSAGHFNVGPLSRAAIAAASGDRRLVRRLRDRPLVPHFAHHHLARYGPPLRRPFVMTVHDLIRHRDLCGPEVLINRPNLRDQHYLRRDYAALRAAAAVIAISARTRADLLARLGLDPARVHVVHSGLDHARFRPVDRRLIDGPYVLFVGSEHPRKNLPTLLRAFALLKRDRRWRNLRLVKVGAPGRSEAAFGAPTAAAVRALGLADQVDFVGHVPDDDLPAYYCGAVCLVLPSRAEGFGFPPLEAMACGCPVVVSTAGALPEVVGDAGLLVAPDDVDGLRRALEALLADDSLRRRLRERGLRRAQAFTWDRTAEAILRVYEMAGVA
jgi:glycosyltransferase involved in cell wall biosynthesis